MHRKPWLRLGFGLIALLALPAAPLGAAWFQRGDVNGSGSLTITDPIQVLRHLFGGDPSAVTCRDAADADDSGVLDLSDAVYILDYLFLAGPRPGPADLFGGCWFDETPDDLDCAASAACQPLGAFFSLDRSQSSESLSFKVLQREAVLGISQLADGDEFGIAFFDSSLTRFPTTAEEPAAASPETRAAATTYVESTQTGYGTCAKPALLQCLAWAGASTAAEKMIVHISDGRNTCNGMDEAQYGKQALAEVTARNTSGIPIRTIGIGEFLDDVWLKALAAENGGEYAAAR